MDFRNKKPQRVKALPTWVLIAAPVLTLIVSNADVLLLSASKGELRNELQSVLLITVPMTALACGLTTWLLIRLRREILRRAASEEDLRLTVIGRDDTMNDLRESLEREQRLHQELDHRVRNNLSSLLGLFGLYESTDTAPRLAAELRAKIAVLRDVYGLIGAAGERGVNLEVLLRTMIESSAAPIDSPRFELAGPPVHLPPREANAMAMIAQELVTNSAKHGALCHAAGLILISWTLAVASDGARLELRWSEKPVEPPRTPETRAKRIGLELIRGFTQSDLRGRVDFCNRGDEWIVELSACIAPVSGQVEGAVSAMHTLQETPT
ncbi:MAG: HWE histidine kinase domain-containing protein [Phycisphaerales bacterium]